MRGGTDKGKETVYDSKISVILQERLKEERKRKRKCIGDLQRRVEARIEG